VKKILLCLLLFSNLVAFEYIITAKELNHSIEKKFPIEKKILFSKFIFSDPKLSIDKKSNFIFFICNISNSAFVLENGELPVFKVFAKSDIRYDGKNIYLKNIKIEHISNKHLSKKLEKKLIFSSEALLNLYFSKKAIYKIENASAAVQLVNSVIEDVIIKDGVIKVKI
jgi:hypothetical protein